MSNVRMAYLLICHKNPAQINIFISQLLQYGNCDVYLHIDSKSKSFQNEIIYDKNVFCYSKYDVRWGSFEIVLSGLYLMKKVKESGRKYTHIYFGSGQDLLVKNGLYEYLEKSSNSVFIRINGEITNHNRAASRYLIKWPKRLMIRNDWHIYRFIRIGIQLLCVMGIRVSKNKKTLKDVPKYYEGRTWFISTIDVMQYILDYCDTHPDYVEYWNDSLASDLMFFQTIIMNSKYKDSLEDELMYVEFGKTFGTINHPLTVRMGDIEKISKGNYFFARKFEILEDKDVIKHYIELIKNRR